MNRHDDLDSLSYSGSPGQAMAERAAQKRLADDTLIIPRPDGILTLHPTTVLRWYREKPKFRAARAAKLQQLWRDRDTGSPFWRDVPTATGEVQKP